MATKICLTGLKQSNASRKNFNRFTVKKSAVMIRRLFIQSPNRLSTTSTLMLSSSSVCQMIISLFTAIKIHRRPRICLWLLSNVTEMSVMTANLMKRQISGQNQNTSLSQKTSKFLSLMNSMNQEESLLNQTSNGYPWPTMPRLTQSRRSLG